MHESTPVELTAFEDTLMAKIEEALGDNPTAKPGPHCRYCPVGGAGQCPEKNAQVRSALLLNPKHADQLVEALNLLDEISSWVEEVEGCAHNMLRQGAQLPGYKLVEERAQRKWADTTTAQNVITELLGDQAWKHKFRTPAQIEKLIKKAELSFDVELDALVTKQSTGTTVVRDSDKRDAVVIPEISDALNKLVASSA